VKPVPWELVQQAVQGLRLIGADCQYEYGGKVPPRLDCSGFVLYGLQQMGLEGPYARLSSRMIYARGAPVVGDGLVVWARRSDRSPSGYHSGWGLVMAGRMMFTMEMSGVGRGYVEAKGPLQTASWKLQSVLPARRWGT